MNDEKAHQCLDSVHADLLQCRNAVAVLDEEEVADAESLIYMAEEDLQTILQHTYGESKKAKRNKFLCAIAFIKAQPNGTLTFAPALVSEPVVMHEPVADLRYQTDLPDPAPELPNPAAPPDALKWHALTEQVCDGMAGCEEHEMASALAEIIGIDIDSATLLVREHTEQDDGYDVAQRVYESMSSGPKEDMAEAMAEILQVPLARATTILYEYLEEQDRDSMDREQHQRDVVQSGEEYGWMCSVHSDV